MHGALKIMYTWKLMNATEAIVDKAMYDMEDEEMVLTVPFGNAQAPVLDVIRAKESDADAFFFETVFSSENPHVVLPMPSHYKSTVNQWVEPTPAIRRPPLGIPPRGKKWSTTRGGWETPSQRSRIRVYIKGCGFLKRRHEKRFVNDLAAYLRQTTGNAPPVCTTSAMEYLDSVFAKTDIDVEGVLRYHTRTLPSAMLSNECFRKSP